MNKQLIFNRVNPGAPEQSLGDDELSSGTNIDFSLGKGALYSRRGQVVFGTVTALQSLQGISRNYNLPHDIGSCKFYINDGAGTIYRGSATSYTAIVTGASTTFVGMNSFREFMLMSGGGKHFKDDGTTTTEWIKQVPSAPTITVNTLAPLSLLVGGTFGVTESGTNTTLGATATADTSANNRVTFSVAYAGVTDLSTNGANTIGDFGVYFVDLAFDNPSQVTKISQDFSLGDATFSSYWHAEVNPQDAIIEDAAASAQTLIDAQLNVGAGTGTNLSQEERERMIASIRDHNRSSAAIITRLRNTLSPWAVARPDFVYVGEFRPPSGLDPWSYVYAVRYTIEFGGTGTATIANPTVEGAQNFPLNDVNVGYSWWQTYATLDTSSNKIGESAPSPPSARTRMQNSNAIVVRAGTATGTQHGITHVITYRQGGFTRDAYAVSTVSYSVSTITDTLNDIQALSQNYLMPNDILPPSEFPGNIVTVSEPFNERVFVGNDNLIRWSLPGQLDAFPRSSIARVSNYGDFVKTLIAWPPGLVVVNQYSVFELTGADFESGQYLLSRSGSKHGSIPHRVPIKTPHGIPLLNYDGLTMYIPGQGVDVEIPWLNEQYGDAFRGNGANDPATRKGNRIPAINQLYLIDCSAAYAEGKLYLAAPTDSDVTCKTVFVIDFNSQRCWWYTYPFSITSMFWDYQASRLFAGTTNGVIMQLESGLSNLDTSGTPVVLLWQVRTKTWSVPQETILENVFVESEGVGPTTVHATFDGTFGTYGTLTNTVRAWNPLPLNGLFNNRASFNLAAPVGSSTVYQLMFDLLEEPARVKYHRTEQDVRGYEGDKLWDVAYHDVAIRTASSTITAVTFIDGVAVMTATLTNGATTSRLVHQRSFPFDTFGRTVFSTYTSSVALFQHFNTYFDARNEPAKVNNVQTDIQGIDEQICDGFDTDINPAGTAFGTCYVDNVALTTGTFTGTSRQSFTTTLPKETYGRTIFVNYTGTGLKHYRTWYHLRPEPDRWVSYVSDKVSGDEHEWKVFKPEVNCLANTVLGTVFLDGTAISTHTITGITRQQHTFSLPVRSFGRTIWCSYTANTGQFKHYTTDFEGDKEPPKVTLWRTRPYPLPADAHFKTWQPVLDPRSGTITGTLFVDDVAISTQSFTGLYRQAYSIGIDLDISNLIRSGSRWEAIYSASTQFKHYETICEVDSFPFEKVSWAYHYRKSGGASQIDLARFWSLDYSVDSTNTATYFWDINGTQFTTGTLVLPTGDGWSDRIPFPPGARGQLFEFRLKLPALGRVNSVNIDLLQEGIKGLTRRGVPGTPQGNN